MNSYPNSTDIAREILFKMVTGVVLIFCSAFLYLNVSIQSLAVDTTPMPTLLPYFATPTPQPVCPPKCDYLNQFWNLFILKLKFPYQKETTLNPEQIKMQREKIRTMQEDIVNIIGLKSRILIAHEATPYILFIASHEVVLQLAKHPLVERIYLDSPMNEAFDMELENVKFQGEDNIYISNALLPYSKNCLGDCAYLSQKVRERGKLTLSVTLKLSTPYDDSSKNWAKIQTQNANIRKVLFRLLKALQGQRFSVPLFIAPWTDFVFLSVGDEHVIHLLWSSPYILGIKDVTDERGESASN